MKLSRHSSANAAVASRGTAKIALDNLEWGDGEGYGRHDKKVKKLPDGVTPRMVLEDVLRIGWPALLEYILRCLEGGEQDEVCED